MNDSDQFKDTINTCELHHCIKKLPIQHNDAHTHTHTLTDNSDTHTYNKDKINLAWHLQICVVPSSSCHRWYKREREGEDWGRTTYRSNKRGLWHLSVSAHTKAAYYLILHTTERGNRDGQRGRESKTYSGCQKRRGSNRHHRHRGALLAVTQGVIVLKEGWSCSLYFSALLSLSLSAKPDSARPWQPI